MKTIKFFHPEETFVYYVEKCFCRVVYSGQQYQLLVEIHSTEDLDHVEGDSLQNDFPQVSFTIEDFPIQFKNIQELAGKTIDIPNCYEEIENEEGEIDEFFYANVFFDEDEFEADDNVLSFSKNNSGNLCLKWNGRVQDFSDDSDDYIPFELECEFSGKNSE